MSRIGKKPIVLPKGAKVTIDGLDVTVEGPKGKLQRSFRPEVAIEQQENQIVLTPRNDSREARGLHGLSRTLLHNMIVGVTDGYTRIMEIQGVGYRAEVKGNHIVFALGYSHPIEFPIPEGLVAEADAKAGTVTLKGSDKELLGQTAARIRKLRPPEPYKGKGIRYKGENVRRKVGKSGAA